MRPDDDLSDLERRLADCRPTSAGLDADAMLFAAGRAAGLNDRRTNWAWPAATIAFAAATIVLGSAFVGERSERLALAKLVVRQPAPPETPAPTVIASAEQPAADSYFAARQRMDSGSDELFATAHPAAEPIPAPAPEQPTLRAWSPDLEQ